MALYCFGALKFSLGAYLSRVGVVSKVGKGTSSPRFCFKTASTAPRDARETVVRNLVDILVSIHILLDTSYVGDVRVDYSLKEYFIDHESD